MNISDEIEQFILSVLGGGDEITLSRGDLAQYFSVAPSQINYVLATRFSLSKGYIVRSKRGGGGITLVRISQSGDPVANQLKELEGMERLPENRAADMAERLRGQNAVTDREKALILAALTEKALAGAEDSGRLRREIYKQILITLMQK